MLSITISAKNEIIRNVGGRIASNSVMRGGIDLNSANLSMLIKRDASTRPSDSLSTSGKGVVLPFASQDLVRLSNIEGLEPKILSIIPASRSGVFSELVAHP